MILLLSVKVFTFWPKVCLNPKNAMKLVVRSIRKSLLVLIKVSKIGTGTGKTRIIPILRQEPKISLGMLVLTVWMLWQWPYILSGKQNLSKNAL